MTGSVTARVDTVSPSNGNFPISITQSSTPIAHTSALAPSYAWSLALSVARITSGALGEGGEGEERNGGDRNSETLY